MAAILAPRLRRTLSLLLVLSGAGLDVRSGAAQSLADVAKKEEARRKAVPAPTKVYTNKDLSAVPAGSPPPPVAASPPATPAGDADKAATDKEAKNDEPAKDQAYWAGRRKALVDKLDRDQTYTDALQTRVNSLTADVINRDDPAQRAVLQGERQKAAAELARLQKEIVTGRKALADLEEEARRAGVPPGWMR